MGKEKEVLGEKEGKEGKRQKGLFVSDSRKSSSGGLPRR